MTLNNLTARKALTDNGVDVLSSADQFSFILTDENGREISTAKNVGTEIEFEPLPFETEGQRTYYIKEDVPENQGGILYDTRTVEVKVTVVNDKNVLKPTVTYNGEAEPFQFENKILHTSITPEIVKKLDGFKDSSYEGNFEFNIELTEKPDGFEFESYSKTISVNGKSPDSQTVRFNSIDFTQTGEYVFKISETKDLKDTRVVYGENDVTLTVSVDRVDDGLVASETYTVGGKDGNEIVNKLLMTNWTPNIQKTIIGNAADNGGKFTFKMEQIPGTDGVTFDPQEVELVIEDSKFPKTVPFQSVTFEKPGTYRFRFYEVAKDNAEGVFYDSGGIFADVEAKRDGDSYSYTETYYYQPVEGNPEEGRKLFKNIQTELYVHKVDEKGNGLAGADLALFAADEKGSITPDGPLEEWTSTAEKMDVTSEIQPGHYYVLTEQSAPAGYKKAEDILIFVSDDGQISFGEDGQLVDAVEGNTGVMVDDKKPEPITVTLESKKTLLDYQGKEITPADGAFTFVLSEVNGDSVQVLKKVGNKKNEIIFELPSFSEVGTKHYLITEEEGTLGEILYNSQSVAVTVIVEEKDGKLVPHITYNGDKQSFEFVNETLYTFINPQIVKELNGFEGSSYNGSFAFELTLAEGPSGFTFEKQTETIPVNGDSPQSIAVDFGNVDLYKAGNYSFKISEVQNLEDSRVVYSTAEIMLNVTVERVGEELEVTSAEYTGGKDPGNVIENKLLSTTWTPRIEKNILGNAAAKGGHFTFTMEYDSGTVGGFEFATQCI